MKTLLHNPYTRSTNHTLSLCVRSRCATNNYVIQVLSLKEKIYVQISTLIIPPESCRRCLTITSRKPVITIAKRFLPRVTVPPVLPSSPINAMLKPRGLIWDQEIFSPSKFIKKPKNIAISHNISNSLTPLSERINIQIDNNIMLQKAILYAASMVDHAIAQKPMSKQIDNYLHLMVNKDRKDLVEAFFKTPQQTSIASAKLAKNIKLSSSLVTSKIREEQVSQLFEHLTDKGFPLTPFMTMIIYERMGIYFTGSRGFTANIIAKYLLAKEPGKQTEEALSVIRIQVPDSSANLNFGVEFLTAFKHASQIIQDNKVNLQYYTLAGKNIAGSPSAIESKAFTGQPDNDITLSYEDHNATVTIRIDIKNTEVTDRDTKFCYLRVNYKIEHFQDDVSSINTYLFRAQAHLKRNGDQDAMEVVAILNGNSDIQTKLTLLNNFILENAASKPYARMLILLYESRTVSKHHMEKIITISDEDTSGINSKSFDITDKKSEVFKRTYETFKETESYQRLKSIITTDMHKDFANAAKKYSIPLDLDG